MATLQEVEEKLLSALFSGLNGEGFPVEPEKDPITVELREQIRSLPVEERKDIYNFLSSIEEDV